jgi:GMP synthase (glutamine-hydrolysing)
MMKDGSMADADLSPRSGDGDIILVLRAGDAVAQVAEVHGEFFAWITRAAGDAWEGKWVEHDLRSDQSIPDCESVSAIIITGSICSVTERAPWMLRAEDYIRDVVRAETPLLGICFGHQLMAQALGGDVQKNPRGREIGTIEVVRHAEDPLFEGLPHRLRANATHVDSVVSLPPGATVIASTELEAHAALAFGRFARGVQFHPEIDEGVMRGYIEVRRPCLVEEGLDAEGIFREAADTPEARELLRNFIRCFVTSKARRAA